MTRIELVLGAAALLVATTAAAEEPSSLAREVAELRREVRELRAGLRLMIDLDRERLDLVGRMLNGGSTPGEASASAPGRSPGNESAAGQTPGAARAPALDPPPGPSDKGSIKGTLTMPQGGVAWVYVENAGNRLVRSKTFEMRQVHGQFEPRWAVVQQGTEIRFPNLDATYHNVFSNSTNSTFDLGIYRLGDPPKSYVFNQPGLSYIYCNQHSEMSATVLVVPNPFFTPVSPDGSFTLSGVPSGRRKILAWTPNAEPVAKWVAVEPGQSVTVNLELGAAEERGHLDKTGKPYGSYR